MVTRDAPKAGSVIRAVVSDPKKLMLKSSISFGGEEMIGLSETRPLESTAKA